MALDAALKVQPDIAGVDLNCGCPKRFSVVGGMAIHLTQGSALLENQQLLVSILETLTANMQIPVSCKIRLLDPKDGESSIDRTIKLLKKIELTKVSAIAIHCRYISSPDLCMNGHGSLDTGMYFKSWRRQSMFPLLLMATFTHLMI
jgi:tRNA-dihydrouridine synthase 2